jgi:protein CpxP
MKRIIYLMLFILGFANLANAQQNKMPTPDEIAKKNVEDLDKRLKLNGTQKSIIYGYTFNQAKEQADLIKKQQAGNFNEEDVAKFYKLQNETSDKIRNVLKGEQQTEYDKIIEERLSGKGDKDKKKKKKKKDEEEDVVSDIKGLLTGPKPEKQQP